MRRIGNLLNGGLSGLLLAVPLILLLAFPGAAAAKIHRTIGGGGAVGGDPLDSNDFSSGGGGRDEPDIDDPFSNWDAVLLRSPIVLDDGVLVVLIADAGSPLVSVQLVFLPATVEELDAD